MKCPKCHYIGFHATDRCRHCGYMLARVDQVPTHVSRTSTDAGVHKSIDRLPLDDAEELDSVFRGSRVDQTSVTTSDTKNFKRFQSLHDETILRKRTHSVAEKTLLPEPRLPLDIRRATPHSVGETLLMPPSSRSHVGETIPSKKEIITVSISDGHGTSTNDNQVEEIPASIGSRLVAVLIDVMIAFVVDVAVLYFTLRLCGLTFGHVDQLPMWPLVGFLGLLHGGYVIAFLVAKGQTLGKMAMGIRVVCRDGSALLVSHAVLRTVGYLVSATPVGLGFVIGFFGRERLALHDRLANTRVVNSDSHDSLRPPVVSTLS